MDRLLDGYRDGYMDGQTDGRIFRGMDGWMVEWLDGCMLSRSTDGLTDEWMMDG